MTDQIVTIDDKQVLLTRMNIVTAVKPAYIHKCWFSLDSKGIRQTIVGSGNIPLPAVWARIGNDLNLVSLVRVESLDNPAIIPVVAVSVRLACRGGYKGINKGKYVYYIMEDGTARRGLKESTWSNTVGESDLLAPGDETELMAKLLAPRSIEAVYKQLLKGLKLL